MRLQSLSYDQDNWHLQDLQLRDVSLLVGKNATGKSRALSIIDRLAKIVTQKLSIGTDSNWNMSFQLESGDTLYYEFRTGRNNDEEVVSFERMRLNERVVLNRPSFDKASLYNSVTETFDEINPPKGKLVIHVSRDVKRYPWFEDIAAWGDQSFGFKFGNIGPDRPLSLGGKQYFFTPLDDLPDLLNSLPVENQNRLVEDLRLIGFNFSYISVLKAADNKFVLLQEKEVDSLFTLSSLSQGLYRCVVLLIILEYLVEKEKPSMIIIDDLCEGLDYERATKLGRLVFDKCLQNSIQLIATSNDMFLMDIVDISYWNVLYRKGGFVHSLNPRNHPRLFNKFKFTGLSNFDFFSSDYISNNKDND